LRYYAQKNAKSTTTVRVFNWGRAEPSLHVADMRPPNTQNSYSRLLTNIDTLQKKTRFFCLTYMCHENLIALFILRQ
jgi:hypothetical protein